jgi:hypothetical protein
MPVSTQRLWQPQLEMKKLRLDVATIMMVYDDGPRPLEIRGRLGRRGSKRQYQVFLTV